MGNVTPIQSARPALTTPAPISAQHGVSQFDCGKAPLNDWLRQRAQKNEGRASRCFVVCEGQSVVGFYALAAGSVKIIEAPKALRKNMPPQIPVLVLGRMAVDLRHQGRKVGRFLLRDALQRSLSVAQNVGARAILVHAIDQDVVPFYLQYNFKPFPDVDLTLFLSISEVVASLEPKP
jgi:GNAT superfamily N-acetyltransferase